MFLGVLPTYIKEGIGFDNWVVGLVISLQSFATLATLPFFGKYVGTKGAKKSSHVGSLLVLIASISYLTAVFSQGYNVLTAFILLIVSILLHGASDSMLV